MRRLKLVVFGQVQGVGFRPFVFRLAQEHSLTGLVCNTGRGVSIEVQGRQADLAAFKDRLRFDQPPLARITDFWEEELPPKTGETGFTIANSIDVGGSAETLVSPDTATCVDCLHDIHKSDDRRFAYPFTNCTNCGPRYSIIAALPYDRPGTSMACFPMCPECLAEYANPADRRFHAQPNACPVCGPQVWLTDSNGQILARNGQAMLELAQALINGNTAAIKGVGGFHLACNALSVEAVDNLRQRKQRPAKPFAIMAADLNVARLLVEVSQAEAEILESTAAPIVLCRKKPGSPLPEIVAPDLDRVGVMLPYTPLHHILFKSFSELMLKHGQTMVDTLPVALVMTSGNRSDEPIATGNRQAIKELSAIADVFLLHDRDILVRVDDSVLRVNDDDRPQFIRRSRGYAPLPLEFSRPASAIHPKCVLGVGAELKNTICFARESRRGDIEGRNKIDGFVSQHIGDITHSSTEKFMRELAGHLTRLYGFKPEALIRDLHPDYLSSEFAEQLGIELGLPVFKLQHHFAHAFSVLFESNHQGEALALCLDGSGLGTDGSIWGGELIKANTLTGTAERIGHISRILTPGGDAAARQPWRMAQAYLYEIGHDEAWFYKEFEQESSLIEQMLPQRLNCPINSSMGRLFDAVAGLIGFGSSCASKAGPIGVLPGGSISFEGQAAMWLESIQDKSDNLIYPCSVLELGNTLQLNTLELFSAVYDDVCSGVSAAVVARRFHLGIAHGLCRLAEAGARAAGIVHIGLSGGVMHNATLSRLLPEQLRECGLSPLVHRLLPPGDGCISFGQAAWGMLLDKT